MKSLTMTLMLATATLTVASTVASAQALKAEIPFDFRAGKTMMTAGTYTLTPSPGEQWFQVRDENSRNVILLMTQTPQDPPKSWTAAGHPALAFACGDSGCVLRQVWTGRGAPAHAFSTPKSGDERPGSLAVIRLVAVRPK